MRRARVTYQGAFHHAMNRGYEGKKIFLKDSEKNLFLELLKETAKVLRIRIFAYCIMDNHYHLVLENSSGRMSEFFKKLNGQYGRIYRKENKGKGYVFQDRFKSKIIQDDSYLLMVIGYVLNNPVRAGLATDFLDYQWSSSSLYFNKQSSDIIDDKYVESIFGSFHNMSSQIRNLKIKKLPVIRTRVGEIIGGEEFVAESLEKFDRRKPNDQVEEYKRIDDYYFDSFEKILFEFKRKHKIEAFDIHTKSYEGKRLRGELLVDLRDNAGLTYGEITKIPIFSDLKISSLGWIYKNAKVRIKR